MKEIREPKQKRSIEKKNRIIEAGYQLFLEKGYYKTNTAEIAKRAGVSTGIVYNYFEDKKDIFMCVMNNFSMDMQNSMLQHFKTLKNHTDLKKTVVEIIELTLDVHHSIIRIHEEVTAMSHMEPEIREYFKKFEENLIEKLVHLLQEHNFLIEHPHEKLHIIYDLVENYCHETIYHNHECVDADIMKDIISDMIVFILS